MAADNSKVSDPKPNTLPQYADQRDSMARAAQDAGNCPHGLETPAAHLLLPQI
jgi:hypothetical protein